MTPPPTAPATSCRNCGQPVPASAPTCVWCGVAQQGAATAFVVAPGASAAASAAPSAAPSASSGSSSPVAVVNPPAAARAAAPSFAPRGTVSLGPEFRGNAAGTAMRVAAFTVDVVGIAAAVLAALLASGSAILGGLVALDLVVLLWVLEGRTGLTLGNALLRIRTSRDDAPYSPGVGRSFVRLLITGIGLVAAVAGAWVVVASSAWDPSRRGRGWADRAARTVTVAVARRERVVPTPSVAAIPRAAEAYAVGRADAPASGGDSRRRGPDARAAERARRSRTP